MEFWVLCTSSRSVDEVLGTLYIKQVYAHCAFGKTGMKLWFLCAFSRLGMKLYDNYFLCFRYTRL